jgi:lysophospholipase
MPFIPDVDTFVSEGLNKRATFFGCGQPGTLFIVYLPNVNYTYPSNQRKSEAFNALVLVSLIRSASATSKVQYTVAETDGMIANGVQIATQNDNPEWPDCLACAIKNVDGKAPKKKVCKTCFTKYCYRQ